MVGEYSVEALQCHATDLVGGRAVVTDLDVDYRHYYRHWPHGTGLADVSGASGYLVGDGS